MTKSRIKSAVTSWQPKGDSEQSTIVSRQAAVIEIKGARSNNLKNIDVSIPKNQLVVVTGLSGSGKSSLIIDTLYAEGQRRYVESLSAYARQFLNRMKKPDIDYIKGLCPAIAIEQKVVSSNARSTVGSLTEIYDYLRLLFARIGKTYSPKTGKEIKKHSVSDVVDYCLGQSEGSKIYIVTAIQSQYPERNFKQELEFLLQKGFARILHADTIIQIEDLLLDKSLHKLSVTDKKVQSYYLVIDRFILQAVDEEFQQRLADSISTAFSEGIGKCIVHIEGGAFQQFSTRFEEGDIQFLELTPQLFNYNNSYGACPVCEGYGRTMGIDENKVVPDQSLSVYEGCIACWTGEKSKEWLQPLLKHAHKFKFAVHKAYQDLSDAHRELLWEGNEHFYGIRDYFKELETKTYKIQNRIMLARYRGKTVCHNCKGGRLRIEASYVKVASRTFMDLMHVSSEDLLEFFKQIPLSDSDRSVADRIIIEIISRLSTLVNIGLSYLTLDRLSSTLSGGESQRIHLTRTLGSNLTSSLYILDEPSIGLHPRDTKNLIQVLNNLRNLGNTVVVIEHEEEIIRQADYILDIGPKAGIDGGHLVFAGAYDDFLKVSLTNLTSGYLTGVLQIPIPTKRRKSADILKLKSARMHNLKNIDVNIPLHAMVAVTGVSGSGKTTLIKHLLYPGLQRLLSEDPIGLESPNVKIEGAYKRITQVELVNQQAIGKSSRSNPATYVDAYDEIRDYLMSQHISKIRGYTKKHFSFNVEGGRCEACKGDGEIIVEMQFLADVALLCEDCNGKRFKNEILEVEIKGKNVFDILNLSVDEAIQFFVEKKNIVKKLKPLQDVGLGYLKLGQSSSTLSGGEAQRVKLAYFLGQEDATQHILFIFDEPTTGLHFEDIRKLLIALQGLIEKGHSVLIVEHNMEVIKTADWVIDLGPEGGKGGGHLLYEGPPEGLTKVKNSYTGMYLKEKM